MSVFMPDVFDTMRDDRRWGGFGYLGMRRSRLESTDPEAPPEPERVAETDAAILNLATERGWDYERLFEWADSKNGRWFADAMFGTDEAVPEAFDRAVYRWRLL